ncbi:MAG: hypothetical protein FJ009_12160 [Chloroflexi bacterium]|nr:hypothetical protein [Chloroflexota bacterium]
MGTPFDYAVARLINACAYVKTAHDLATKWRLDLTGGFTLDLYFNETLGKYSYTLIQGSERVMGWDNAAHHPGLANFPHHAHRPDGRIVPSRLGGDPKVDLDQVRQEIETFLSARKLPAE